MSAPRPMRKDEALAVHLLAARTFTELGERLHDPPSPPPRPERALIRISQLIGRDPGGAWVTERDGELVGAALAIERDGLWGLSLLVVDPEHQSAGLGRELLARALEYGDGGRRGAVILASPDARALRAYARAGFAAHPCFRAEGRPREVERPGRVRDGDAGDIPVTDRIDLGVRGAPHGSDIDALLRADCRLLVIDDRGYAVVGGGAVRILAALDEEAAVDLLRAALTTVPFGEEIGVEWITSHQDWAIAPVLDAGLSLTVDGALFVRGDVGPFRPYLPSGAYL